MRKAGKTRSAAILCLALCSGPALADIADCPKADIPASAWKGIQKAAKREYADPLDHATLYYCAQGEQGRATVDTVPVPRGDGSENRSTLVCSGSINRQRDWTCEIARYQAIRVVPDAGQPEVLVEVSDRVSIDSTREHAIRAFALLNQPGRVEGCRGSTDAAQTTESLLAILARRYGPYRLVFSREGFALMRGNVDVRFRSGIDCWKEEIIEE